MRSKRWKGGLHRKQRSSYRHSALMRQIPDLMLCLQELSDGTVRRIRKTAEDPPRVAVYDVLQLVTGCSAQNCSNVYSRVADSFPEVLRTCSNFKFSGRGQRETPVADARTTVATWSFVA